ncbi:hypothetical protein VTO42DRAFT_5217 [Malbranchea cinnamomea]
MGLPSRIILVALVACSGFGRAVHKPFSVHDDVLAFPQFEVVFPDEYILESEASSLLAQTRRSESSTSATASPPSAPSSTSTSTSHQKGYTDLSQQTPLQEKQDENDGSQSGSVARDSVESYEEMVLHGQKFLCEIPKVTMQDEVASNRSTRDQEKELARATERGLELLREMEGKCMYYSAGWWSYSFCYMNQVRQFHALLPGNGVPAYPPREDSSTSSFVLGRFHRPGENDKDDSSSPRKKPTTEVAVRETRGDSWYLVQYLEGGTICDITDKPRKVEVQFHCHPQSSDHIGWIKEVSTCSYVMAIYTPRLCNDVAFQPPRVDQPHDIVCREILAPEEVPEWEAAKVALEQQELLDESAERYPNVGGIEVGAMKLVGKEGRKIEKGKVAFPLEEKVEVIAQSQNGEYTQLSKEKLKKLKLDPKELERVRKELDDYAQGQDWKLEMVDVNGARTLRGIIDTDGPDEESSSEDGEEAREDKRRRRKKFNQKEQEGRQEAEEDGEDGKEDSRANDAETGSEEILKSEL